jgi:hypothetical protein
VSCVAVIAKIPGVEKVSCLPEPQVSSREYNHILAIGRADRQFSACKAPITGRPRTLSAGRRLFKGARSDAITGTTVSFGGRRRCQTIAGFDRIGEENAFAVLAGPTSWRPRPHDIINLGIGQPDFRTPDHIVEAAVKALRDGQHGYTPATGIAPLREAVSAIS